MKRSLSGHEQKIINASLNRERVRQNNCYFNERGILTKINKSDIDKWIAVFDLEIMLAAQDELQWRTYENFKDLSNVEIEDDIMR